MPDPTKTDCPQQHATTALARGALGGAAARAAQAHLERCEPCRDQFRAHTDDIFPQLPDYTILENVGKGGFGLVYRAIHHGKQRTEALKIHNGTSVARAASFHNEVRLIAKLHHPNIATLYEANLAATPPYYAMEFIEGRNLSEHLREQRVTLWERIQIVRDVATAIGYAHAEGILHRDIKPQNIMIDGTGRPMLVDFGISKRLGLASAGADAGGTPGSDATPEGAVGTLGYIAPEQIAGDPVDARADIFALGVLLFHCVTGEPAKSARRRELCLALLNRRRISRAADLAAIIARCVEPVPAQRYPNCGALVADLDNYLRSWMISAVERPTARYRAARVGTFLLRNFPVPVRVASVVAIAALLTLTYGLVGARSQMTEVAGTEVVLVAFTPETLAAIRNRRIGGDLARVSAEDRKSWRLLHARLVEALDRGGARVIAWDYFFPDLQAEFDPPFAAAIRQSRTPVVVGSRRYDADSRPEISPAIAAAVHSVGALVAVDPRYRSTEYVVPLAILRGYEVPIPSLSVAAFAAARFPDCAAVLHVSAKGVELRYRRREAGGGGRRFRAESDPLPVYDVGRRASAGELETGDLAPQAHFSIPPAGYWERRTISYEAVLTADEASLRRWFAGRLVVVGEMTPGQDQWPGPDGRSVFGCQVQALALQSLLAEVSLRPYGRWELIGRMLAWCAAGAVAAMLLARMARRAQLGWVVVAALLLLLTAVVQAVLVAGWGSARWVVELSFALAGLLGCGGVIAALEIARQRPLELAPAGAPESGSSTVSSTLLRETQ